MISRYLTSLVALIVPLAVAACGSAWDTPANTASMNGASAYMAERRDLPARVDLAAGDPDRINSERCGTTAAPAAIAFSQAEEDAPLSPGDLVLVSLPGNEPPSGNYKVDTAGTLSLDVLGTLRVRGLSIKQAEAELARRLVAINYFRPGHARVTLRLLDRGAARVQVSGAVFQPGRVVINGKSTTDRDMLHDAASGDYGPGRALSNALANASGVRPDADITHVAVVRDGRRTVVDLTGMLTGDPVDEPLLADGDRVEVPSRGCFQQSLVRPSAITPPGVRAYVSNLTIPAAGNGLAGIGRDATTFPYGTRLLQALTSGNCIGGMQSTNADRWAVLISVNPVTNRSEVIERRIEELVRRADRDGYNPVLMPGDSIACYDSRVSNVRDVLRGMTEWLGFAKGI